MAIVTLTSDWNKDDFYVAAVKGRILSRCPDVTLVDITHQVPAFNIAHAGFLVRNSYRHFPDHTIHVIAVKCASSDKQPLVAVQYNNHYFIGTDNGIFGLILDEGPLECIRLESDGGNSFPVYSVLVNAACDILQKKKFSQIGKPHRELYKQLPMLPAIDEGRINGSVVYIDSYKNAITNISRSLFEQIGKGRPFEIQGNHFRVQKINKAYNETSSGEILAIFNSLDLLEIAMYEGNAADLLNLDITSSVRIRFKDPVKQAKDKN